MMMMKKKKKRKKKKRVRVQRQVVNKEQRGREAVIHCWVPFPAEKACLFHFQFKVRWEG